MKSLVAGVLYTSCDTAPGMRWSGHQRSPRQLPEGTALPRRVTVAAQALVTARATIADTRRHFHVRSFPFHRRYLTAVWASVPESQQIIRHVTCDDSKGTAREKEMHCCRVLRRRESPVSHAPRAPLGNRVAPGPGRCGSSRPLEPARVDIAPVVAQPRSQRLPQPRCLPPLGGACSPAPALACSPAGCCLAGGCGDAWQCGEGPRLCASDGPPAHPSSTSAIMAAAFEDELRRRTAPPATAYSRPYRRASTRSPSASAMRSTVERPG